jgi:large subunit ribosomal protein L28
MAKKCVVTGKGTKMAGRYSNKTRATQFNPGVKRGKNRRKSNLSKRKIYIPELGKSVHIIVSNRGMKTIRKRGAYETLKKVGAL